MCLQLQRPPGFDAAAEGDELKGRIKVLGCVPRHLQIEEECESGSYINTLAPILGRNMRKCEWMALSTDDSI